MNSQSARIFLAIVEHGSVSAAAQALYISQPAVSSHLNRLEEQLGFPLLVRQRGIQRIQLTSAGEAFIPVARQWMEAERSMRDFREAQTQRKLRLGGGIAAHDYLLAPLADKLCQRDPLLRIRYVIVEHRERFVAAREWRFDVALHFSPSAVASSFVHEIPFFMDGWCVFCPADTPLPDRPLAASELDPAFAIRQRHVENVVTRWHSENFLDQQKAYAVTASGMVAPWLLRDSRCWTVLPRSIALYLQEIQPGKYACRSLARPIPPRRCYIAVAKDYRQTEVVRMLLDCGREYLAERPSLECILPDVLPEEL